MRPSAGAPGNVLYVTFDGILQPLGYSQVARVVAALGRRGLGYALLSVERSADLADEARVRGVEAELSAAGVEWVRLKADLRGSARASCSAIARAYSATLALVRSGRFSLVHARAYQSTGVAYGVQALTGVPYVFDARGSWIEERSGRGDWFSTDAPYALGKFIERKLYASAAAIVTLTELQKGDIRASLRGPVPPMVAIPTCADYEEFELDDARPAKPEASSVVPESIQAALRGRNVLGMVGSLNISYAAESALELARYAVERSERAHLLILSKQTEAYQALLERIRFPPSRVTISECAHSDMAAWMRWIDWGLLLLPDVVAKRGSMPTKLAEFFASGVRPIAFGCNSEVRSWVRRAGSGIVLDSLDRAALHAAAAHVASSPTEPAALQKARSITEPHFGLRQGVERYAELLRGLSVTG